MFCKTESTGENNSVAIKLCIQFVHRVFDTVNIIVTFNFHQTFSNKLRTDNGLILNNLHRTDYEH